MSSAGSNSSDEDSLEEIDFRVTNMEGIQTAYRAATIEHLRLKIAIQNAALYPSVLLFTPSGAQIENSDDLCAIFGRSSAVYDCSFQIEDKEERAWVEKYMSVKKWISVLQPHLDAKDGENALRCARAKDSTFDHKLRERVRHIINATLSFEELSKFTMEARMIIRCLGASVSTVIGDSGNTLLHQSATYGHMRILHAWMDAQVNAVNARNLNGCTALYCAIALTEPHFGAVRILLNASADPCISENKYTETPLHAILASKHSDRRSDIVSLLLDAHADVNAVRCNGNTPLHNAVKFADVETIQTLIKAGADPTRKNKNGKTAHELACESAVLSFTWDDTLAWLERKNALLGKGSPSSWEVFRARMRLHLF